MPILRQFSWVKTPKKQVFDRPFGGLQLNIKWVYRICMDSAQNSDSFYGSDDDKYLEYSSTNRRTIELLGKLLDAAKRAQDQGKNLALNKIILEANRLSNRLNVSMLKTPPTPSMQLDFTQGQQLDEQRDSQPRKMFFTEAIYLKNKQALAQQAKQFVQVRGVIVD